MPRLPLLLSLMVALVATAAPKSAPKVAAKTVPKKAATPAPTPPPPPPPPTTPMPKVVENLSEKVTGLLQSATKVQAWRVSSAGGLRPDPARAIADFQREGTGKDLSSDQLKLLRGVLYDEKSYKFDADVSRCEFSPNVTFSMTSGIDTLEALVSFKCSEVFFFIGKPGGRWLPGGAFEVKAARKDLLELVKTVLKDDAETQAVK